MSDINNALSYVLGALSRHDVDYIVIGGQAEILMGGSRLTKDVDICYQRTDNNFEKLAGALQEMSMRLRNVPADVPFRLDARTLKAGLNFTFENDAFAFDILGEVEPIGGFEELKKKAAYLDAAQGKAWVIDLEDLIRIKEHLKRLKDGESLAQLYAIRRLRSGAAQSQKLEFPPDAE